MFFEALTQLGLPGKKSFLQALSQKERSLAFDHFAIFKFFQKFYLNLFNNLVKKFQ